jgi:hypothetical protein
MQLEEMVVHKVVAYLDNQVQQTLEMVVLEVLGQTQDLVVTVVVE